ncbi:hypothetical protein ACFE04_013720 [Oxalis oulophora]
MPSLTVSGSVLRPHSSAAATLALYNINKRSHTCSNSKLNHCSASLSRSSRRKPLEEVRLHNLNKSDEGLVHQHIADDSDCRRDMKNKDLLLLLSADSLLNFMSIFGFLILQVGSQPALAAALDIPAGPLQSIPYFQDLGDITTGFTSAFLLIFFSELGDKTFFIAALLAARNSAPIVFLGTFGALSAMTIVSVLLGRTFHYIDELLPFSFGGTDLPIDDIAAVCLLVYFGVSTLLDAASSDSLKAEDEQKEAELAVSEFQGNGAGILSAASTIISTFALVFVAEWGDKSFFSTIDAAQVLNSGISNRLVIAQFEWSQSAALAAASSPLGVIGGALAGHGVATLIAVLGGSILGTFLSEKATAYIGGVLFLVFAAVTLIEIVN